MMMWKWMTIACFAIPLLRHAVEAGRDNEDDESVYDVEDYGLKPLINDRFQGRPSKEVERSGFQQSKDNGEPIKDIHDAFLPNGEKFDKPLSPFKSEPSELLIDDQFAPPASADTDADTVLLVEKKSENDLPLPFNRIVPKTIASVEYAHYGFGDEEGVAAAPANAEDTGASFQHVPPETASNVDYLFHEFEPSAHASPSSSDASFHYVKVPSKHTGDEDSAIDYAHFGFPTTSTGGVVNGMKEEEEAKSSFNYVSPPPVVPEESGSTSNDYVHYKLLSPFTSESSSADTIDGFYHHSALPSSARTGMADDYHHYELVAPGSSGADYQHAPTTTQTPPGGVSYVRYKFQPPRLPSLDHPIPFDSEKVAIDADAKKATATVVGSGGNGAEKLSVSPRKRNEKNKSKGMPLRVPVFSDDGELTLSFCLERPDGFYRHPSDCARILQCYAGEIFEYPSCSSHLAFDEAKQSCDYRFRVKGCSADADSSPDVSGSAPVNGQSSQSSSIVDSTGNNTSSISSSTGFTAGCQGRNHGDHVANANDCTSFFRCVWERMLLMSCPKGTVFNPRLNVCDYPDQVPSCVAASTTVASF